MAGVKWVKGEEAFAASGECLRADDAESFLDALRFAAPKARDAVLAMNCPFNDATLAGTTTGDAFSPEARQVHIRHDEKNRTKIFIFY